MDDHALLQVYRQTRSDEAFAQLVGRHTHWVYSVARRRVGDAALAEEITQAVFIVLAQRAANLQLTGALSGWLMGVLRKVASRAARRHTPPHTARAIHQATTAAQTTTDAIDPHLNAERAELMTALDELVWRLKPEEREPLLLRYYEQRSWEDVAQLTNSTSEAARKRVARAIDRLRDLAASKGLTAATTATTTTAVLTALESTVTPAPAGLQAAAFAAATTTNNTALSSTAIALARPLPFTSPPLALTAALLITTVLATFAYHNRSRPPAAPTPVAAIPATQPATKPALSSRAALLTLAPGFDVISNQIIRTELPPSAISAAKHRVHDRLAAWEDLGNGSRRDPSHREGVREWKDAEGNLLASRAYLEFRDTAGSDNAIEIVTIAAEPKHLILLKATNDDRGILLFNTLSQELSHQQHLLIAKAIKDRLKKLDAPGREFETALTSGNLPAAQNALHQVDEVLKDLLSFLPNRTHFHTAATEMKLALSNLSNRVNAGERPTRQEIRQAAGAGMQKIDRLLRELESPPPATQPAN